MSSVFFAVIQSQNNKFCVIKKEHHFCQKPNKKVVINAIGIFSMQIKNISAKNALKKNQKNLLLKVKLYRIFE